MRRIARILTGSVFALMLVITPVTQALSSNSGTPMRVPPEIASARTIFISNAGGSNYFDTFTGGANRGYSQLYAALQRWGKYRIVDSPSQADLIFQIQSVALPSQMPGPNETYSTVYNPQLVLRIRDPKTGIVLWTTTANIHAFGFQASRDKGFDQAVEVLVDRMRQLTGEPLNAAQLKAVQPNSKMGKAKKILILTLLGAGAGFVGFVIYKATHSNTPSLPSMPPCVNPPFCTGTVP